MYIARSGFYSVGNFFFFFLTIIALVWWSIWFDLKEIDWQLDGITALFSLHCTCEFGKYSQTNLLVIFGISVHMAENIVLNDFIFEIL